MTHENAFQTGPVTTVSARTYLRLRFLDARAIAARFSRTLSPEEMRALLQRRNAILECAPGRIPPHGSLSRGTAALVARPRQSLLRR